MNTELKVLLVLLVAVQWFIKTIHGLITTLNLLWVIVSLFPIVLVVSWYRKVENNLDKRKLIKYILLAFPLPQLLVILLYILSKYRYAPAASEPVNYLYIHFAVWGVVLIFAVSTYMQREESGVNFLS